MTMEENRCIMASLALAQRLKAYQGVLIQSSRRSTGVSGALPGDSVIFTWSQQ